MSRRWLNSCIAAAAGCAALLSVVDARAAGTAAGTDISNTAQVSFEINGAPLTRDSNTVTLTVAELLDVEVVLQSAQSSVGAGDTARELLFAVTNTGNGQETLVLSFDNDFAADPAVDFNPAAGPLAIYFDTDGSLDFSPGDVAYDPGTNDPLLSPDASIGVLLVNDIPAGLSNGDIGRSQLAAAAATGSGAPGSVFAGQGDGGVDAIAGATGAAAAALGEYLVAEVTVNAVKSAIVSDAFGGNRPVPGATIIYTIAVEVTDTGTASNVALSDPIPANTSYTPGSLRLNGTSLTDAAGDDAGELDTTAQPTLVVRLGDLTQASGIQSVEFQVVID